MSLQSRSLLSSSRSKFIAAFVLTMLLMLPLLIYSLLSRSVSAQTPEITSDVGQPQTDQSQKAGCCGEDKDADKPHLLAASYYSLKDNLSATLMLNNKGPKPIEVQPTLFSLGGERLDVEPVTVEGNTFRNIDLREWVALGGASFEEGSLQVFHRGKDLVLGAQVYLVDANRSLSFEEKLTEFPNAKSSRLEGIWWLPSRNSEVRLVLSNTSDAPLSVAANVDRASPIGKESTMFDLSPHETRVINMQREFTGRSGAALQKAGGISLEHFGSTGELVARAMVQEASVGYSSPVQFSDPQAAKSNELHGAGLRLGMVADQRLTPVVVARNIGSSETALTGRMPYSTDDGRAGVVSLPEVRLSPGEVTTVNLAQAIRASDLHQNDLSVGLEFEYTGEPGSVLMSAQTISRDRNHVFRVPMWDPKAQREGIPGTLRKILLRLFTSKT